MKKRPRLTLQESKVWQYILGYDSDNSYSPTLSEIAEHLRYHRYDLEKKKIVPCKQTAFYFVEELVKKGYLKKGRGWRNIRIIEIK